MTDFRGCYSEKFQMAILVAEEWGRKLADRLLEDPGWPTCDQLAAVARNNEIMMQVASMLGNILATGEFAAYRQQMLVVMMRSYRDALPNFAKQELT